MFKEVITINKVPPNFIDSILTNPSLYEMFKNEFEINTDYFQNICKEEYLHLMLKFIEDTLFSSNIFHIYSEEIDIEEFTKNKLSFIRSFYDDFILEEIKKTPENILSTKFFKGLEFAKNHDTYAQKSSEFNNLYKYVFTDSIDYFGIIEVILNEPLKNLKNQLPLPLKDFELVSNYVKNNIQGYVDMDIVTSLLHNHAYKTNHIFDAELAYELIRSMIKSYAETYNIELKVKFRTFEDDDETDSEGNTIYIEQKYIDAFISLNYVELFQNVFYEANKKIDRILIKNNSCNLVTLKCIMNLLGNNVDLYKFTQDENLTFKDYEADLQASSFISTLKFFSSFGVNLFDSYIKSKCLELEIEPSLYDISSDKEISLDQRFHKFFSNNPHKKELIKDYPALSVIYNKEGDRLKLIDLIKKISKNEHKDFILEYLHSRIIDPISMIDDMNDFANYHTSIKEIKEIVETEMKYIYVDTFFYSLNSYLKMYKNTKLDLSEFLDDLLVKVNCLKDTPLTHRFIDECLFTIEEARGNI